ncbi:alpha-2-macroglobulin family protein [Flavobacterium fluviale]|uniref:Alpha-2-macroglobulin domain-containing protein n=1 Tax=Flavobacterium fluviale TaxID=2249356 RepID=A0A344LNF9_9FLAO|nr:alpha-2-macroglobulin family protein [Flavobacterium fluviale]AXB55451.1 hypothetical protein HYN86_02055 [Flavobacterium fluviale]
MKNIIFLLFLISSVIFGQENNKKWTQVISLENEGKVKSASEIVAKIYKKAINQKDEVEMIRCFFYQSKYLQVFDKNAQTKILNNLKTDINRVSIPSKAILNLVYARCLNDYYQENSYTIQKRTNTAYLDNDFLTWTEINFINEVNEASKKSLENEIVLKSTSLTKYKAIFDFSEENKQQDETVFDYVLNENINIYTQKIKTWEIIKNDFIPYKKDLLGKSNDFIKLNFDFVKNQNLRLALRLYQKKESDNPTLENSFDRLRFCKIYLINLDEHYTNALINLQKSTSNALLIQKIQLEKAISLHQQASKEKHPDYNIQAIAILDSIFKNDNSSNAFKLAIRLKENILYKSLSVQILRNSYVNENTRAYIQYKNVDRLRISFYKINQKQLAEFNNSYTKRDSITTSILKKNSLFTSQTYSLIDKKDYFDHTTEVVLPKLETGSYLVEFENNSDQDKKLAIYGSITTSNITVLATQNKLKQTFQVLDRKTGKPIENVNIKSQNYTIKTDKNGLAYYMVSNDINDSYNIEFSTINDTLTTSKSFQYYNNKTNTKDKIKGKVQFYLDRAIYRPGQIVYYKGIAIKKQNDISNVISNTSFKITVQDPNYKDICEFAVKTNDFGSFSGKFLLPKSALTGNFIIKAQESDAIEKDTLYKKEQGHPFWDYVNFESSQAGFKVEEYKRPKFEVTFEPKKESFKINKSVKIKGNAKAFAGSNISDSKVVYTVTRYTRNFREYYTPEESEIIASGETTTDALGKFSIDFIASPSKNSDKKQLPVFNYQIKVSVTDINGETHDKETNVKIGYHNLVLNATLPAEIQTKNKNEIKILSTNLNDEFLATKGDIKIYFETPLSNKFKKRIWGVPDVETIPKEEFDKLFPYEKTATAKVENTTDNLVYSKKIDTKKDKNLILDFISNYKSGNYKIVFSAKDDFDNFIESTTNFKIIQSKDKFDPSKLFKTEQINADPKKDGFVFLKLTSVIPELYIITTGNYESKIFFEETFHLQNHETFIKIPLKNEFKNSIKISFQSVFENENFNSELNINLKTLTQKLEWDIESFRSKIQPGSNENWSFKLNAINTKKESEVLAAMYDSSLDQFGKENWEALGFNDFSHNLVNYKTILGFDILYNNIPLLNSNSILTRLRSEKTFLNTFGFNILNRIYENPHAVLTVDEPVGSGPSSALIEESAPVYNYSSNVVQTVKGISTIRSPLNKIMIRGNSQSDNANILYIADGKIISENDFKNINPNEVLSVETLQSNKATALYGSKAANGVILITTKKALEALTQVKARKNLSETAFFFPNLKTDSKGKVSFNFTSPEALTAWKLRLFAHNKDAVSGYLEKSVITQKELMVLPNFPRFFREKDTIVISAKISNVTAEAKTGIASLQFFDAVTMQPIDAKMLNAKNIKNFTIPAYGNTTTNWTITIPEGLQGIQYKIVAKAGNFSDGEENILPVLTNNMLVTESIPIWVRENSTKEYTFENLKNNNSTTLKNHQLTLEYTSNSTWIAVQSLPYLMEYEHECAEQTFARYYANALASEIISSNPKIAAVFENWRKNGKPNSKLEENEELKSLILAETPWLNDAQSEDEKKKNLSLLFDLEKIRTSQEAAFEKLKQKQKPSGGFSWFDGGSESEYITRHILAGLGHLEKLSKTNTAKISEITKTGIPFLDDKFLDYHKMRTKNLKAVDKLIWINPYSDLHYLYTRSFYLEKYPLSDTLKKVTKLYLETAKKDWLNYSIYEKGLAALTLNRFGEKESAKKIIESLKETSSNNEDWGMYWIANKTGWYWYQAPIETQALLIEAFAEVIQDIKSADAMKVWLLKNKQTKNWPTTKSTTEAIYALLMQGTDWLSVKDNTVIKLGDEKIMTKKLSENEKEAETGYIKLNWKADEVKKEMASIKIQNKSKVPAFGGVYWQYFEDLDKIKNNTGSVLSVSKELYLKRNTVKGNELEKITTKNHLKTGDLVTVRLIITAKEDTEYIHLKDMRASCFEPVNVLSEYQYKDRLGFYMSTKDAATHFFFDQINKGTYVLEYDIRVNNSGEFSNGITTIQSMYAPEFASHTKGIRVKVN